MSILEMIFIGGVTAAILSLIGILFFFLRYVTQRKQLGRLPKKKFKNKKKNKKISRQRKELQGKKKQSLTLVILFTVLTLTFSSASAYLSYYQSMNLTTEDSDSVVRGYYLLRDFEEQLILARDQGDEEEKLQQNIRYLATAMASYGTKKASNLNAKDGQIVLNRYYTNLQQLGMNVSTQLKNIFWDKELTEKFIVDLSRVIEYEEAVFVYYKVNKSSFSEK